MTDDLGIRLERAQKAARQCVWATITEATLTGDPEAGSTAALDTEVHHQAKLVVAQSRGVMTPRVRRMRRKGIRYIGARTVEAFSAACRESVSEYAMGEGWILGVVYDRGADKAYGTKERYAGPNSWNGQPVYWIREEL